MQRPPHDQKAECRQFIRHAEDEVLPKSAQAKLAIERGDDLSELLALYSAGRDAWNSKAEWLRTNGPLYLRSGSFVHQLPDFPQGITEDGQRFFFLLAGNVRQPSPRTRDLPGIIGIYEDAQVFPCVQSDLNWIHNNCRNEFKNAEVETLFHVRRMPASWNEFIMLE